MNRALLEELRSLEELRNVGNGRIPRMPSGWRSPLRAATPPLKVRATVAVEMIEVYADESGKLSDSEFLCFCAYLSDSEDWKVFAAEWARLLSRDHLNYIHMRELFKVWGDETYQRLADYRKAIQENTIAVFSVALDLAYYRTMDKWKRELLGKRKPMQFCFSRLMRLVMDKVRAWEAQIGQPYPDGWGSLIFDDDEEYAVQCYRLYSQIRRDRPDVKRFFSAFTAADDKIVVGLQAADVLAWYSNKDLRRRRSSNLPLGTTDPSTQPETFKSELYDAQGLEGAIIEIIARGLSPTLWF